MKRYVVGFLFLMDRTRVVLTRKTHPSKQAGKLNGVGGHVESQDYNPEDHEFDLHVNAAHAMEREGIEELGHQLGWRRYATMVGPDWICDAFMTEDDMNFVELPPQNDAGEALELHHVQDVVLRNDIIPNLSYLIPLALDRTLSEVTEVFYRSTGSKV